LALSAWRMRRPLTSCRWTEPWWSFLAFRNDDMNLYTLVDQHWRPQ
jgi:hypothetical protein